MHGGKWWKIESVWRTEGKNGIRKYRPLMSWQAILAMYEMSKSNTFHVSDSAPQLNWHRHTTTHTLNCCWWYVRVHCILGQMSDENRTRVECFAFFQSFSLFLSSFFVGLVVRSTSSRTFSRGFTFQHHPQKEQQKQKQTIMDKWGTEQNKKRGET